MDAPQPMQMQQPAVFTPQIVVPAQVKQTSTYTTNDIWKGTYTQNG